MSEDLIGRRFGRLTVVARNPSNVRGNIAWQVQCDCGSHKVVTTSNLKTGNTRSCGCLARDLASARQRERNETHGMTNTPTWSCWAGMRARCENTRHKAYGDYGGRGVTVCERWKTFENFLADMGERPAGLTIERKDPDGNYEPANCRWATVAEQNRNKRDTVLLALNGETKCVAEWATAHNINLATLRARLRKGWSPERALTTPIDSRFSRHPQKEPPHA